MSGNCSEYRGLFWIYLSTTQISITIIELNSTLCFSDINMAHMKAATEMNESFQVPVSEAGFVLAEFGP